MKVLEVEIKNIMGISYARIHANKNTTTVAGKNGAGKTTLLDSVAMTLGGAREVPELPIKIGEDKGECSVVLSGEGGTSIPWKCRVRRRFWHSKDGDIQTTMNIVNEAGLSPKKPQELLDAAINHHVWDPLALLNLKPMQKVAWLKEKFGLDFSEFDAQRKALYDARTETNRKHKAAINELDRLPEFENVPDEPVDVSSITAKIRERQTDIAEHNAKQVALDNHRQAISKYELQISSERATIEEANKRIASYIETIEALQAKIDLSPELVVPPPPIDGLLKELEEAEATNEHVRENQNRLEALKAAEDLKGLAATQTRAIKDIDAKKHAAIASAEIPIEGLQFGEHGLLVNGVPFEQCSRAEQFLSSLRLTFNEDSDFRFAIIRNGSSFDSEQLQVAAQIVEECDGQLIMEIVGEDSKCDILLRDGVVVEVSPEGDTDPQATDDFEMVEAPESLFDDEEPIDPEIEW